MDESVYRSESATGHRNRAIGHLLRNFVILSGDPEPVLDLYFRQRSIAVDCRDLGVMAATQANAALNPGKQPGGKPTRIVVNLAARRAEWISAEGSEAIEF